MNIDNVIKERYSCRSYTTIKLTNSQLYEILDAARYAPSPKNRQPWRFVVLREEEKTDFLNLISDSFSNNSNLKLYEKKLNEHNSEKKSYAIMKEAYTIILVFNAYPSIEVLGCKDEFFDCANIQSIGAAIQNMLLKATELKIGSLWICDIFTSYKTICDYYKNGQLIAAIALGYAKKETKKKTPRKSLDTLILKNKEQRSRNLIWVGPRESDICDCSNMFQGSVTIFGSNCNGNIAYCTQNHIRIDHNAPDCIEKSFWINGIKKLKKQYPNSKILYYNSEFSFDLEDDLRKDVVCYNHQSLLKMLKDKATTRMIFSDFVPIVPFQILTYNKNLDLSSMFPYVSKLIFQTIYSSGGYGTNVVNIENNFNMDSFINKPFMVSPYFEKSIPVNVHLIVGNKDILYFPGSVQIIHEINNKLIYLGADFITFQTISLDKRNKLKNYAIRLGEYLQGIGYRGILGFDFLITKDEIMFIEVNARFQASTPILNIALKKNNLPSMQEMQLAVFENDNLPQQTLIDSISVSYSMISYIEGTWNKEYSLLDDIEQMSEIAFFFKDGFCTQDSIKENSYLFKMIFNTNCTSINSDYKVDIYENLIDLKDDFFYAILNKEYLEIKISLLNQGVTLSEKAKEYIEKTGKIRNAVFSAVDLTIFDSLHINCPRKLKFSIFTPWKIDVSRENNLLLFFYEFEISNVTLDLEDIYCNNIIKEDIKFSDVCFWATDRLRIHHNLSCYLKNEGLGCKFCEITASKYTISIDEILDVVDFYLEKADTFRHFLIGGGSEMREIEYQNILKIIKHIRKKSTKDIYVMSLPPKNLLILKDYYESGVTEIGFNIEVFDTNIALKYMPGKGKISRQEYFNALKEAVKYWGNTGKVRSLMIIGLEAESSSLQCIRELCKIGVMPILSVFRPIPGTSTENIVPPSNHFLKEIYIKGTKICKEYSLHLGPACHSCQNNTLSLPY